MSVEKDKKYNYTKSRNYSESMMDNVVRPDSIISSDAYRSNMQWGRNASIIIP